MVCVSLAMLKALLLPHLIAQVKHSVDDLEAGESVILTLEDRGILDDKGNLVDDEEAALENILVVSWCLGEGYITRGHVSVSI